MKRVRVGSRYVFEPRGWDSFRPAHNGLPSGAIVTVVNLPGCPRAGTMGHCHVNGPDGRFAGLVMLSSLHPFKE